MTDEQPDIGLDDIPEESIVTGSADTGDDEQNDELEFVRDWFPNPDDYRGKTNISAKQARYLTVMRHLPDIFPDMMGSDDMKALLNDLADNVERYQTSINGKSREQQQEILKLVGGGQQQDMDQKQNQMLDWYMKDMGQDE